MPRGLSLPAPSYPQPQAAMNLLSVSVGLPGSHAGLLHIPFTRPLLCLPLSLTVMCPGFTHVGACVIPFDGGILSLCMCRPTVVYPFIHGGHGGRPHLLAVGSDAAINPGVQVLLKGLCSVLWGACLGADCWATQSFTAAVPLSVPTVLLCLTWHLQMPGRDFSWLSRITSMTLETGPQNLSSTRASLIHSPG